MSSERDRPSSRLRMNHRSQPESYAPHGQQVTVSSFGPAHIVPVPSSSPRGTIDVQMSRAGGDPTQLDTPEKRALKEEVNSLEQALHDQGAFLYHEAQTALAQQRHGFEAAAQEYHVTAQDVTKVEVALQTFGQSQPCIRYLVKMENAEESLFWVKRSYRNPPSVLENVFSKHRVALQDFVRPQARRICSHKIVYDRQRGHEISLLFRLLIRNLPIDRVQANCSDGKVPKTASDPAAKKFMQLYSADFSQRLPEGASLSQLYDTLCEFLRRKTRTSRKGFQMPENEYDRMKCALKWEGFYLHEDEVKEICSTTVMEYYAYAQQSSAV